MKKSAELGVEDQEDLADLTEEDLEELERGLKKVQVTQLHRLLSSVNVGVAGT